jgi:hypothetical protein
MVAFDQACMTATRFALASVPTWHGGAVVMMSLAEIRERAWSPVLACKA